MSAMQRRGTILALSLGLGAVAATGAFAQQQQQQQQHGAVSALKGHDTNAPVDVSAQRIEVQDRADRAVFVGDVHARQADLTLDTDRLTVAYSSRAAASGSNGTGVQIHRLDAAGGVVVHSPSETARGDFGIYDIDRRLITVLGNVQLNQGSNQVNGSRLVIDLDSGRAVIDGGPPGVNSSGGRVTGHFTVPQRQQQR